MDLHLVRIKTQIRKSKGSKYEKNENDQLICCRSGSNPAFFPYLPGRRTDLSESAEDKPLFI